MLTEDDARNLLAQAADTIPVGDGRPLPVRRHRRWVVPAAAAAVVATIAAGGVLIARDHPAGPVDPIRPTPVTGEHTYGPDEVPAVVGYTEEEATAALMERGLVVTRRDEGSCLVPGFALRTDLRPGTRIQPGDRVRLSVSADGPFQCITDLRREWQLIRFARGLDGPPPVVGQVRLAPIRRVIAAWVTDDHAGRLPVTFRNCVDGGSWRQTITIEPLDVRQSAGNCPATHVRVEYDAQGRITSARLVHQQGEETDPREPSVLQLPLARHFVKWARGQAGPPAFAEDVTQIYRDHVLGVVPRTRARSRSAWEQHICSGFPPSQCGFNPLAVITDDPRGIEVTRRRSDCTDPEADLPGDLASAVADVVEIRPKSPRACADTWAIELWTNADGLIYAVNLKLQAARLD